MYAIVQVGSSQFKVAEGDVIEANRLNGEKGEDLVLDKVLMFAKGTDVRIGQPYLQDVQVTAKIVKHSLADKLVAFKYRRRKDSSSKIGHRQKLTELNITAIKA